MRKLTILAGCVMLTLACSGCGVVPAKVQYAEYKASTTPDSGYPFRLRRSVLLITQDDPKKPFVVKVAPSELEASGEYSPMYWISGVDNLRSTTQLKITYLDNTKLPDTVQSTTQDNIADTINKVGSFAAAAIPAVASLTAGSAVVKALPFNATTLDPQEPNVSQWHK